MKTERDETIIPWVSKGFEENEGMKTSFNCEESQTFGPKMRSRAKNLEEITNVWFSEEQLKKGKKQSGSEYLEWKESVENRNEKFPSFYRLWKFK